MDKHIADDMFVLFKSSKYMLLFVTSANRKYSNMKFTLQIKVDNSFLFCDSKILRFSNTFTAYFFRKQTFTAAFFNFNSSFMKIKRKFYQIYYFPILFVYVLEKLVLSRNQFFQRHISEKCLS